jgi:hypothetical protein
MSKNVSGRNKILPAFGLHQYDGCKPRELKSAVVGAYWNKRMGSTRR